MTRYGLPETIPQFIDGKMIMVPFVPEQYTAVKISPVESTAAVKAFRKKFKMSGKLSADDIKEALRLGREKKFFQLKDSAYFKQVYSKH